MHDVGARPPRPLATLLVAATTVAVVTTLFDVERLGRTIGLGRLCDLQLVSVLRHVLEQWDLNLLAVLPEVISHPFDMGDPASLFRFMALGVATKAALNAFMVVLLAPPIAFVARAAPGWNGWERTFPLSAIVFFSLPETYSVVHRRFEQTVSHDVLLAVLLSGTVWATLILACRRPAAVRRLLRVAGCASVVTAVAILLGASALRPAVAEQPAAMAGAPNVLLVSIDSLRPDHLHSYGYERETSPTIDALAREGTRFNTVVAPTPWTLPSHLTLLTSLPPEAHGVVRDGLRIRRRETTFLAQVFWRAGYTTGGFVSGPYLDADNGFSHGFDHYDDYTVAKMNFEASHHSVTSPGLLRIVSKWLSEWDRSGHRRPFFIFLHMWDVHYDYTPPPPYDTMFDPDYRGDIDGVNFVHNDRVSPDMDPRDLAHVIALYDGEIRFTDFNLGKVLDALRTMGVLDDTIIVVTADHGDEFFEHGHKGHAKVLYDETLLVPLVIRFPRRVPAGKAVDAQVRLMDVAPTILSLAGLPEPDDFGTRRPKGPYAERDLTPFLLSDAADALPELPAFGDIEVADAPRPLASIRTSRQKFIFGLEEPDWQELYDLTRDAPEKENLAGARSVETARLRTRIEAFRTGLHAEAERIELSQDQKTRLRALGYLR